jgi:probable F420-dependent oxidoreductase
LGTFDEMGKIGVWTGLRQWPEDAGEWAEIGAELEGLGFGALWIGGSSGQLPVIDAVLGATTRLVAATGIIQIWANPAEAVAAEHHRLTTRHPGRFLLGLGVGHAPAVEAAGQTYARPLGKLASYLDELDGGDHPVPISERVIAALRPKALALAATRAAGAHPYNVSPAHTAKARAELGPSSLLIPEQKILFTTDATVAREVGRRTMSIYLGLPNYLHNLRALGFDDTDFAAGGSDRFIDTMVAWGSAGTIAARVQEHLDAGANQVAVQVLSDAGMRGLPRNEWRQAAEALLSSDEGTPA